MGAHGGQELSVAIPVSIWALQAGASGQGGGIH